MNLLDLMVKIGVDDQTVSKLKGIGERAKRVASGVGKVAGAGVKVAGAAMKATAVASGAAAAAIGKDAIEAYANYEQLAGGVAKLYGAAGQSLKEYAKSQGKTIDEVKGTYEQLGKAEELVMSNAQQAYKTAGMSANDYMENATSFSAALIDSLGGDTLKAAEQTDVAMRAISDNYNTFGGDMENVTNAFKGFSKQNYSMLDNLKLGYGGTKTEMERLIQDANEWGAANGKAADLSIDSFSDVVTAIDYIQQKQQIAGTTAREAGTTIEGSMNSMKAAWTNLLAELGKEDGDIPARMNELFTSVFGDGTDGNLGVAGNIVPAIQRIAKGVGEGLRQVGPMASAALKEYGPSLIGSAVELFMNIAVGLAQALPGLVSAVVGAIPTLVSTVRDNAPQMEAAGIQLFNGIGQALGQVGAMLMEALGYIITHLPEIVVGGVGAMVDAGGAFFGGIVDGFLGKQPEVEQTAGQLMSGVSDAALANADGAPAGSQWMDSFNSQFDFSGVETAAVSGVEDATAAAAKNADGSPIADKVTDTAVQGIDKNAMNDPATQMVKNAIDAAKNVDASSVGETFSSTAAGGVDTEALRAKVAALASAASSVSTNVKVGIQADTSGVKQLAAAASGITAAYTSAASRASAAVKGISASAASVASSFATSSAKAVSALGTIATKAASVASSVKSSLNGIGDKTVKINVARGSTILPHFYMNGEWNPKTKSVPSVGVNWYANGAIFGANQPGLIGIGDAPEPEVAAPLSALQEMLDFNSGNGDTYNVYLQFDDPRDYNEMALGFLNAVETAQRMRGRSIANTKVTVR